MTAAVADIWLPFDPRDWEQLTPTFGRFRSMVGAHGPKFIANKRAAAFFDQCVHEGRLELALVAPDHLTYRQFDEVERRKLTIRVPLKYEEGCSIEPYHDGYWYARRSNLEKLERQSKQQPQQPPKRKSKRKLQRKPRRNAGPNHEAIAGAGNRVLAHGRRPSTVLPPIERQKTKPWITNEAVQMKKDGQISADIGISEFAREFERRMRDAAQTDPSVRPVSWKYIKNHLSEWGLWPVSKIPRS